MNRSRIKAVCHDCKLNVTRTHQIVMHTRKYPGHTFNVTDSHEHDKYGFPISITLSSHKYIHDSCKEVK